MVIETRTESDTPQRIPLTRGRVLEAAVELADSAGIGGLTMRKLAEALGVEAMSLYYHVANKEALLDGVVEVIIDEINQATSLIEAPPGDDWKSALRLRILTARTVMLRHKWAPKVIEDRTTMNPALLHYFHGILEVFRAGGVSYDLAHHAMHTLGSRALGFTQELFEPDSDSDDEEQSEEMLAQMAAELPLLVEMLSEIVHDDPDSTIGWCDDQTEFEFGLDVILDGLERLRQTA
ncbi:MAG TPA: TetR/AcrR family transcriptional regulator C-terminal domain-containing protein [Acidimicrobiia bacterium]